MNGGCQGKSRPSLTKETTAEILTVGNEILTGKTVNTNASHICSKLSEKGVPVSRMTTVGDEVDVIAQTVMEILSRDPRYVVVVGGLGPTFDDVTVQGVASGLDRQLVTSRRALEWIAETKGLRVSELSEPLKKMGWIPEGAEVLRNRVGDAPGLAIQEEDTKIFVLPGVPDEMKSILSQEIMPGIEDLGRLLSRSFVVENVYEASMAPLIEEVVEEMEGVFVKSHVRPRVEGKSVIEVEVRMWSREETDREKLSRAYETLMERLREIGGEI